MSKQIDERVVEMRFDNAQFEKNVHTSMSTIDKLKEKLKFKGASDGFENLSKSARKVDLNTIGSSAEKVGLKFNAMYTMADQAFRNITNSAMLAGKNIVKAFTITPVKTGFNEYELKMGSIQTIMASTGEKLEKVNEYLNELNEYSDQTIYSFSDMTQNIGKFTNAGVKLEDAVAAIKGVANEAALSGANANEASRAMYNFAQALSAGYVKLIDWKSIENANMATVGFKEQLIETALEMGTLTKVTDGYKTSAGKTITATKNFNDSLQDQWMTSDVLITTLKKYTDLNTKIGQDATKAATEVKTFTQMMDSLKESAQSGWAQTWELVFGDFHEGKALWTSIYNVVGKFLDKMADARNALLSGALGKNFKHLSNTISGMLAPAKKAVDTVKTAASALEDLGTIVNKVIIGEFGNGKERIEKLTAAGYKYAKVQNAVNEKLGSSVRHLEDAADSQKDLVEAQEDSLDVQKDLKKSDGERIASLAEMTDAELKALKIEDDQIKALGELQKEADKAGLSVKEFVDNIDNLNGRWLLLKGFENIGTAIATVFKSIGEAWRDAFPAMQANQLYDIIAGFHKLTTYLVPTEETAGKLTRTFKGLFAILDIVTTLVMGPTKLAFKIVSEILGLFNLDILDATAAIGDAIVAFRDWLDGILDFTKVFEKIAPGIKAVVDKIGGIINGLKDKFAGIGGNIVDGLKNGILSGAGSLWNAIVSFVARIIEIAKSVLGIHSPSTVFFEIGQNIIEGFKNGLSDGVSGLIDMVKTIVSTLLEQFEGANFWGIAAGLNAVVAFVPQLRALLAPIAALFTFGHAAGHDTMSGMVNGLLDGAGKVISTIAGIAQNIIEAFCGVLGIHSPSTVMFAIGGFLILGLIGGMIGYGSLSIDTIKEIALKIVETASSVLSTLFDVVKSVFGNIADYVKNMDVGSMIAIAITTSLLLMARRIISITSDIADGIKGIGKLGNSLASLSDAFKNKLFPQKTKFQQVTKCILEMALAVGVLAASTWLLAQVEPKSMWQAIGAILALSLIMGGLVASTKLAGPEIAKAGSAILAISGAMLALSFVAKIVSKLDPGALIAGGVALLALSGLVAILMNIVKKAGPSVDKAGPTILKVAGAMLILSFAAKIVSKLDAEALIKGSVAIFLFSAMVGGIIALTKLAGPNIDKAGITISKIAGAILLLAIAAKVVSRLQPEDLMKGTIAITALSGIVVGLVAVTRLAPNRELKRIGTTLLSITGAIAILALTAAFMGKVKPETLLKGLAAITALSAIVVGLIAATRLAPTGKMAKISGTLMGIAGAVGILSLISVLMGIVKTENLAKGIIAVGLLSGMVTAMIAVSKGLGKNAKGALIGITVVIAILAAAAAGLSFIEPDRLASATAALMLLMGSFIAMAKSTKGLRKASGMMKTLIGIIVLLSAAVIAICLITDGDEALTVAKALTLLMGACVGLLYAVSAVSKIAKGKAGAMIAGLVGLAGIIGAMYLAVQVLKAADGIQNGERNVKVLVTFMGSLMILYGAIAGLGALMASNWWIALGVLAGIGGLAIVLSELYIVIDLLTKMDNIKNAAQSAEALSTLMDSLTKLVAATGLLGGGAIIGSAGLGIVMGMINMFLNLVNELGKSLNNVSGAESNILDGIEMVKNLVNAMTECMQAMTADRAAIEGIAILANAFAKLSLISTFDIGDDNLELLGNQLESFGKSLSKFGESVSEDFDSEKALGAVKVAKEIVEVYRRIPWDFGEKGELDKFSNQLNNLGRALKDFGFWANMIDDPRHLLKVVKVAKELVEAYKEIPWDFGEKGELDRFASQLNGLGRALKDFGFWANKIDDPKHLTKVVKVAKELVEAYKEIPFDWNHNDFEGFANQLESIGSGLNDFSDEVNKLKTDPNDMLKVVRVAKQLIEAYNEIPFDWNHNDLTGFANQLVNLGTQLETFSGSCNKITDPNKMVKVAKSMKALCEAYAEIPFDIMSQEITRDDKGQFESMIYRGGELEKFAYQLESLGSGLWKFYDSIDEISDPNKMVKVAKACASLAEAAKEIPSDAGNNNLIKFSEQLGKDEGAIGKNLKAFCDSLTGVSGDKVEAAANAIKSIAEAAEIASTKDYNVVDLADMSDQFEGLGTGIAQFGVAVQNIDINAINGAASVAGSLVDAMVKLNEITFPNLAAPGESGDPVSGILSLGQTGQNGTEGATDAISRIQSMTEKFKEFGKAIAEFNKVLTEDGTQIDTTKITAAAEAGKTIATTLVDLMTYAKADGLDIETGLADLDLTGLSGQLETFGSAISAFNGQIGDVNPETITAAAESAKTIVAAIKKMTGDGDTEFGEHLGETNSNGHNKTNKFIDQLTTFGEGINAFYQKIKGIGFDTLSSAVTQASSIIDEVKKIGDDFGNGLGFKDGGTSDFENEMTTLGKGLVALQTALDGENGSGGIDKTKLDNAVAAVTSIASVKFPSKTSLDGASEAIKGVVAAVKSLSGLTDENITSYNNNMTKLGTDGIDAFVKAFNTVENTSATDAMDDFITAIATHVDTYASETTSPYTNFKSVGEYCVTGFVAGIKAKLQLAKNAGASLYSAAEEGTRQKGVVRSPSRAYAKVGYYCVAGFGKGIEDNLADVKSAGIKMGEAVLTATQDYLGIHSPSLVFNKEVGRYIVQGIAEGIKDETEAEKQAREKAEKIVNAFKEAFQKEIDKYNTGKSIADSELELWTLQNPKATDEEVYNKQLTAANEDLARQNHIAKLLHDQWRQAEELCKQGLMTMDEVNNFYDQYVKQMVTAAQASDKVVQLKSDMYDSTIDAINTDQSLDDAEWEFWKSAHKDASDEELDRQYELYLRGKLSRLWGIQDTLIEAAHEAENRFGKGSAEAKAAWQKAAENATSINKTVDSIEQIAIDRKEAEREEFRNLRDLAIDNDDKLYQIWEKTLGRDATDEEKEARKLVSLTTKATNQTQLLNSARVEWLEAKAKFGEGSLEEQEAYQKYLDNELNLVTTQGEILDIQEAQEKRRERLIDKQNLAKSEYDEYIKKYKKYYEENGKTLAELEKDAKLVSGYDPSKVVEANNKKTTSAMVTGLTNLGTAAAAGVGTATSAMTSAASTFGTNFVSAISSQSQSWVDAGTTLANAFLGGLTSNTDKIKETGKTLANATLEAIQESLDSDSRPVITPVLDLSTVNQQLASLNAVTSARQAAGISSSMSRDTSTNNQNRDEKLTGSNIYNYVQNNYSPKALSRTEIFRDTKTLLATKKGA